MQHEQPNHTSRSSVFMSSCVDELLLTSVLFPQTSEGALYQQKAVGQRAGGNPLISSKLINVHFKRNNVRRTGIKACPCIYQQDYASVSLPHTTLCAVFSCHQATGR